MAETKQKEVKEEVVTPEVEESTEEVISKKVYDKKVAELNKKLKEKMSEDERKEQEYQEKLEELENLKLKDARNTLTTGLLEHGIEKESADIIAESIINGDFEAIAKSFGDTFSSMKDTLTKEIKKVQLESTERPSSEGGDTPKNMTRADFSKLSLDDKQKLFKTDPEKYQKLANSEEKKEG